MRMQTGNHRRSDFAGRRVSASYLSRRALALVVASLAAALGTHAAAEDAVDPFAGVEEMVVQGSSTAALLAPASTAAVAFDSGDLDAYGVEDLGDVAKFVPNLEIRSQNATNASFFVRGVGLQDFGANASSSVPIFQDGVPRNLSATQLVGLFDIGGLSVLKGPQGSGNFRNASAGAFLIEAQKPQPEFSGYSKVSIGRLVSVDARDANRYELEGAFSAPIYEDWISTRLSARYSHENPFWENGCANRLGMDQRQTASVLRDVSICGESIAPGDKSHVKPFASRYLGEVDDWGFRGQIRATPPDTPLDLTLRVELSHLNRDSTTGQHIGQFWGGNEIFLGGRDAQGYQDPDNLARFNELYPIYEAQILADNPGIPSRQLENRANRLARGRLQKELIKSPLDQKPYRGDLDRPGRTILETHIASMTGLLDFDAFDIEMNGGFLDYRKSELRDSDLSPNLAFPSTTSDQGWEVYGDLKISGDQILNFPIEWATGLWGMTEQVEAHNNQLVFAETRLLDYQQEIYSFGVFAEGRYEFLEAFTLAGGVRYNSERKDMELHGLAFPNNTIPGVPPVPRRSGSRNQRTWDYMTGFGEIRYDFTEEFATYVKFSRGFKAGHFNGARANFAKDPDRGYADPEHIDAFEWGLEFGGWAGRVSGLANFFYYNYDNYQVFRLTTNTGGIFQTIQNSKRARNYGAELDLTITPLEGYVPEAIEGLRINLRGGWLETSYLEFVNQEQRQLGGASLGVSIDYSGNPLISAPNLQFTGTFTWAFDLGRYGLITPQYDFTWSDDVPFGPNRGRGELDIFGESRWSPYFIGNRALVLHNVRLSWEPAGGASGLTVSGWCRNLTDERYREFAVDITTFNGQALNFVADPRSCGADVRFSF